jgi:Protein of unknown function (DUF1501)
MNTGLDRRSFLRGLAALPLLQALPLRRGFRKARALIVVFLDGGMSHLDTFDGKPEASVAVRGDMRHVRADVDGVFLSAHLPKLAARMRRCALIRSLTHGEGNHDRGTHLLLTGHRPSPVLVHPALGAALSLDADPAAALPPYIAIPDVPDFGGAGFLPRALAPFATGGAPEQAAFAVPDLAPRSSRTRVDALVDALDALDGASRSPDEAVRDRLRQRSKAISGDPELRELFALDREPAAARERFGKHRLGQACLLALRLCQGGVGTVLVRDIGWDHHQNVHRALTYGFPPKLTQLDDALSGLIDALAERSLQDEITVCLCSEFGRTPRLNPQAGRDHWPRAQCALLFGAGIRPGAVVGSTDARGEEPATEPVGPADLCATLLQARGADLARVLHTDDGRPVRLVPEGARPIAAALA